MKSDTIRLSQTVGQPPKVVAPRRHQGRYEDDQELIFPEETLTFRPWFDPLLDRFGKDVHSEYVERFWLPILGPSCLLLVRHFATELASFGPGVKRDTADLAKNLGIGVRGGINSPLWKSIDRAARFGALKRRGSEVGVRAKLAPLTNKQVERLTPLLQAEHRNFDSDHNGFVG